MKTICYHNENTPLYANLYPSTCIETRAVMLYFHGGGLLYGKRDDLPKSHIKTFCAAGYAILSFDYRLSPVTKLPGILSDVNKAIHFYINNATAIFGKQLPYFLWGRSAGAYLCLIAAKNVYPQKPQGILSYYGYTFLDDLWYDRPSSYYNTFPIIDDLTAKMLTGNTEITTASTEKRYALYVYARQTGKWLTMVYDGSRKDLLLHYSFRTTYGLKDYPPLFIAHSMHDPDVPFDESNGLKTLLHNTDFFVATSPDHAFDNNPDRSDTRTLLTRTLSFMKKQLSLLSLVA